MYYKIFGFGITDKVGTVDEDVGVWDILAEFCLTDFCIFVENIDNCKPAVGWNVNSRDIVRDIVKFVGGVTFAYASLVVAGDNVVANVDKTIFCALTGTDFLSSSVSSVGS